MVLKTLHTKCSNNLNGFSTYKVKSTLQPCTIWLQSPFPTFISHCSTKLTNSIRLLSVYCFMTPPTLSSTRLSKLTVNQERNGSQDITFITNKADYIKEKKNGYRFVTRIGQISLASHRQS